MERDMTKKLKIIGPYTPEHPGPFCTRDGRAVRIVCTDRKDQYPIVALVRSNDDSEEIMSFHASGNYNADINSICDTDLMNAEEIPVAREFWLVGNNIYTSKEDAEDYCGGLYKLTMSRPGIIHVREVLPGDGE